MKTLVLLLLTAAAQPPSWTHQAEVGAAVADFGPFYRIENAVPTGDPGEGIRAVFDIAVGSEDPGELNRRIETVARFLNMHVGSDFPKDGVRAALVLHGTAARDALDDEAFETRYGVTNPNLPLLEALREAGVGVYLCGQSAGARGFGPREIAAPVEVALSAMTVLLQKQAAGYGLIAF